MENQNVISLLKELIAIDSINPFKLHKQDPNDASTWKLDGNEIKIAEFLEKQLKLAGFNVARQYVHSGIDGNTKYYNLLAEKGSGNKSILFCGHMDTASAKTWLSKDIALTPTEKIMKINGENKNVIFGLGANDMKTGLAVLTTAFNNINPKNYNIKVVFVVDEEFYSLGANVLAKSDFMKDVCTIIVPEIGDGPNQTYGPSTITLGRLGRCEYIIKVPGTGGHGAQSFNPDFINAATECSKIVSEIENLRQNYTDNFEFFNCEVPDKNAKNSLKGSFFVNKVDAGDGSLSVPAKGEISIDFTFTPNTSVEKGMQMLQKLIDDMYKSGKLRRTIISETFQPVTVAQKKRPTPPSGAYITPYNHKLTDFVKNIIDNIASFKNFNMGYSVADENVFRRICGNIPLLVIGPVGENCHKADEWVEIESVTKLKDIYSEIGRKFGEYVSQLR